MIGRTRSMGLHRLANLTLAVSCLALGTFAFAPAAEAGCSDSPSAGIDWSGCRKRNLILSGYDFSDGNLNKADLFASDMRETKMVGTDLTRAIMTRVNISESILTRANLSKVDGGRMVLHDVELTDSSFEKAELFRADFSRSNLTNANLNKTELGRANFSESNLTGAQITFTNLARANFKDAILVGTDLGRSWTYLTQFEGVDLSQVSNLSQQQLNLSCGNSDTKLPAGLTAPAKWPCGSDD